MADGSETIASAVIIPEPEPPAQALSPRNSPSSTSHKRRQSSVSSQDAKRPRLDTTVSAAAQASTSATPVTPSETPTSAGTAEHRTMRVIPTRDEERKRSKRLFGGVLGALSQKPSSTAQRRREDIERKQLAKLRAQDEEGEEEKKRKYDELMETRRREQWDWDEQSLSVRHRAMVSHAEFLKTEAEPSLYWLPFEMREAEKKKRVEQLEQAEKKCEVERAEFEERRRDVLGERPQAKDSVDPIVTGDANSSEKQNMLNGSLDNDSNKVEQAKDGENDSNEAEDKSKSTEDLGSSKEDDQVKDTADDHEEMVMEAGEGEDPVIY